MSPSPQSPVRGRTRPRRWRHDRHHERRRQLGRPRADRTGDRLPDRRADLPGALLMSWQSLVQIIVIAVMLLVTVLPLGRYMANVYGARADGSAPGDRVFG